MTAPSGAGTGHGPARLAPHARPMTPRREVSWHQIATDRQVVPNAGGIGLASLAKGCPERRLWQSGAGALTAHGGGGRPGAAQTNGPLP